jgi:NADP-dependent 3-hydroxy acid dehydrogenase YdfG
MVTGATRGISKAICSLLIASGASVIAMARDETGLVALKEEYEGRVTPLACDLSLPGSRDLAIDAVARKFGSIDGLIDRNAP